MKSSFLVITAVLFSKAVSAQKLDSIFFNLYTDSLKKGTYNYINVDGKFSDGRYLPLSDKDIRLSASGGKFDRNSLFIDSSFGEEKVTVKAVVIKDPSISRTIDIYIKKHDVPEKLPTMEDVMKQPGREPATTKKRNRKQKK